MTLRTQASVKWKSVTLNQILGIEVLCSRTSSCPKLRLHCSRGQAAILVDLCRVPFLLAL